MKLQTQKPGEYKCLSYCAAMLLDISIEEVEGVLGYTGMEIINEGTIPECFRGIHIQEIQFLFNTKGYCLWPLEKNPILRDAPLYLRNQEERFRWSLSFRKGILISENHAVAFENEKVFDPNGKIFKISTEYLKNINEAWMMGIT